MLHGPIVGTDNRLRGFPMFQTFNTARETATIVAGAFLTAVLFISAATSFPIA